MPFWDFKRSPGSVALMRDLALERGIAEVALLRGSGLSSAQLADPNVEIAAGRELKVMANFLRLSGAPPGIGLELGLRFRHSTYGLWGYGLVSSATAQDALNMALRYLPLTYLFAQVAVRRVGELAILQFHAPDFALELQRFVLERDMSAAAALLHELIGARFTLRDWQLAVAAPPTRRGETGGALFGVQPQYSARSSLLAFDWQLLDRRLPDANPITAAMCEQLCAEMLRRRTSRASEAQSVRQYLEIPGVRLPDLPGMARHLNTSERTLKRRLQAEGTSFRLLLESRRRVLARELLKDSSLSLAVIAERLGYADLSSFSQAHKRWHGVSPRARRKSQKPSA